NIWIAFNGGIARMFNTGIERYSSAENLYFDHINKFRSFDEQRKVFAFTPKGVNLFRDNQLIKLTYQQKPFIANDIVPIQQGFLAIQDSLFFSLNLNTQTGVVSNVQQIANLRTVLVALEKDAAGTVFISSIKG